MCRRFRFRVQSSRARSRCGRRVQVQVWWPLPPSFIQTLVINHPHHFSCTDLARRFASPTVRPSISFFPCSIPPHPPLFIRPDHYFSPSPPSPSTNLPLPPSTLTCVAPSGILSCPPSINLDHGQIDFCVVQVRDSGACTQTPQPPSSPSLFSVLRLVHSVFQQPGSGERKPRQSVENSQRASSQRQHPPPPGYEFACSRVECSPAHGRLVRCPVHTSLNQQHPLLTAPPSRSPLALVGTHFLHPATPRSVASKTADRLFWATPSSNHAPTCKSTTSLPKSSVPFLSVFCVAGQFIS